MNILKDFMLTKEDVQSELIDYLIFVKKEDYNGWDSPWNLSQS